MPLDQLPNRRSGVDGADPTQRLRGSSLNNRRRITQRPHKRLAGRRIADQPEGERRHLPYLDLLISQAADQRLDPLGTAHATDREGRSPAQLRFDVGQQFDEVRPRPKQRTSGWGRRRVSQGRHRCGWHIA